MYCLDAISSFITTQKYNNYLNIIDDYAIMWGRMIEVMKLTMAMTVIVAVAINACCSIILSFFCLRINRIDRIGIRAHWLNKNPFHSVNS